MSAIEICTIKFSLCQAAVIKWKGMAPLGDVFFCSCNTHYFYYYIITLRWLLQQFVYYVFINFILFLLLFVTWQNLAFVSTTSATTAALVLPSLTSAFYHLIVLQIFATNNMPITRPAGLDGASARAIRTTKLTQFVKRVRNIIIQHAWLFKIQRSYVCICVCERKNKIIIGLDCD